MCESCGDTPRRTPDISVALRFQQVPAHGDGNCLGTVDGAELVADRVKVLLDGIG